MTRGLFVGSLVAVATVAAGCGSDSKGYRLLSSSMEPTIHCAKPAAGCEADEGDLLATESVTPSDLERGDIIVFETPDAARTWCGFKGTFIHRVIGLPGETIEIRVERGKGLVYVNGEKLGEPYLPDSRRATEAFGPVKVAPNSYFEMGDNRNQSCDSRTYGAVPGANITRRVTKIVHQ